MARYLAKGTYSHAERTSKRFGGLIGTSSRLERDEEDGLTVRS